MDTRKFDEMVEKLARLRSRRSLVGTSLGAAILAVVSQSDRALGKNRRRGGGGGNKAKVKSSNNNTLDNTNVNVNVNRLFLS